TSERRSCSMSITSSSTLDSQLTTVWRPLVMSGYPSRTWQHESQPQFWSKFQVWEWLQQVMDIHQIDASSIPLQNFDMDGHQLCSLSYQDFLRAAGSVGPILFHSITELKWSGTSVRPTAPDLSGISTQPAPLVVLRVKRHFAIILSKYKTMCKKSTFTSHHTSPTPPSPSLTQANPRGTHLWEFIRDILLNPERNPGLIKWEDRTEGVFRFLKSEAVAQLWGKKKNNSSMTYEKLSRAMRYYYKREILERVDGRRLVYKFGRNARGWRETEK
uniref:ETS homologous factor n=1 Tax=Oryzias latipes TaxID=8090 RepID=H2M941_ORYLA